MAKWQVVLREKVKHDEKVFHPAQEFKSIKVSTFQVWFLLVNRIVSFDFFASKPKPVPIVERNDLPVFAARNKRRFSKDYTQS